MVLQILIRAKFFAVEVGTIVGEDLVASFCAKPLFLPAEVLLLLMR